MRLVDICISRSQSESRNEALLPNVKELAVETPLPSRALVRFLQLLLHGGLEFLDIVGSSHPSGRRDIMSLVSDAARLSPSLQTLRMWNDDWQTPFPREWQEEFGRTIARFDLKTFSTDMQGFSQHYLANLASQRELETIELLWEDDALTMESLRLPNAFDTHLDKQAFTSLSSLDLRLDVTGVTNIFGKGTVFTCLVKLELQVVLNSDKEELRDCLVRLRTSCPKLTSLYLFRYDNLPPPSLNRAKVVTPPRSTLVSGLQHLTPLHTLSNLIFFRVWSLLAPILCRQGARRFRQRRTTVADTAPKFGSCQTQSA